MTRSLAAVALLVALTATTAEAARGGNLTTAPSSGPVAITSDVPDPSATISLTDNRIVPPPNDDFANAEVIAAPGTVTGTNVEATLEDGEAVPSCQSNQGASVWWSFIPASDGLLTVDLSGSDPLDTVLSIYGSDGTTELGCDDDSGSGLTSLLSNIEVVAGQTVYIRVAGFQAGTGAISFTLGFAEGTVVTTTIPDGDTTDGPTYHRAFAGQNGACGLFPGATEVRYNAFQLAVSTAGGYTITTSYTGFDGYLFLYQGAFDPADPCTNLVAFNDDDPSVGSGGSEFTAALEAESYTLVVTGFGNDDFGPYAGTIVGPGAVGLVAVANENGPEASSATLSVSPNPIFGAARVRLAPEQTQDVTVAVFDVTGRQVMTLFSGTVAADQTFDLGLDAASLSSGVYMIRATGTGVSLSERVTVIR